MWRTSLGYHRPPGNPPGNQSRTNGIEGVFFDGASVENSDRGASADEWSSARSPELERETRGKVAVSYALLGHLGVLAGAAAAYKDVHGGEDEGHPEQDGGGYGHGHLRHEHTEDQWNVDIMSSHRH